MAIQRTDETIYLDEKNKVVLTETDVFFYKENPHRLTKEGARAHLNDWQNSKNKYMQARYFAMVEKCKVFEKSGSLSDGRIILSRNEKGEPAETAWLDVDFNRYNRRAWEKLPDEKKLTI